MDLDQALQDLYAEGQRVEQVITALQGRQQGDATTPPARRGKMGAAEREPLPERRKRCGTGRRPPH
jgi:hypothetical protein